MHFILLKEKKDDHEKGEKIRTVIGVISHSIDCISPKVYNKTEPHLMHSALCPPPPSPPHHLYHHHELISSRLLWPQDRKRKQKRTQSGAVASRRRGPRLESKFCLWIKTPWVPLRSKGQPWLRPLFPVGLERLIHTRQFAV